MNLEKHADLLSELLKLSKETEWVEFKEAKNDFDFNRLGKYFSALSNEANLKNQPFGWLIFGIRDKSRQIVGTNYRKNKERLDKLKYEIATKTTNRITFVDIIELHFPQGRVVLFKIPASPQGIPIAWEGHYYGRDGESIVPLNIQEIEEIRNQAKHYDWSAQICEGVTISDLDYNAIIKARENYKIKFPTKADEVDKWNDEIFLNKTKITVQGKITRTAIILLGKDESEYFISPSVAKMSWILKDDKNMEKDYEHFGPPFLLNTDRIYSKIRNLKYRYISNNTLFPTEIMQYEPYVIREALNNCIAHQNYELKCRIAVVEKPDELIFVNVGSFLPESVEKVIEQDSPPKYYRNAFLTNAMVNLNMIDTAGGGIKKMFTLQKQRHFPLPDYDLSIPEEVKVKIFGKVIDENYTRLLINKTDLDLRIVMILDRVQKRAKISIDDFKLLKKQKLIEGRYPKIFVSSKIALVTGDKARYIKNRAFDKEHYKKMIIDFIKEYKSASREDIDKLLLDKLSDALDENQKRNKVRNTLFEMSRKDNSIKNIGSQRKPKWVLSNTNR